MIRSLVRETANNFSRKRSIAEDNDDDDDDDNDGSDVGLFPPSDLLHLIGSMKIDRRSTEEIQDKEGTTMNERERE